MIDVGVLGESNFHTDISAREVARSGGVDLATLRSNGDRGKAVSAMSEGAAATVARLYAEKRFDGMLALGGTGVTSVACNAMRTLPLGIPKVMVSTAAGTDVSAYVGVKDIVMIPSIVDVAGINAISREVFSRASGAIGGMVSAKIPQLPFWSPSEVARTPRTRWSRRVPTNWKLKKIEWYFWNYNRNFESTKVFATSEVTENQPGLPAYYHVTWRHAYQGGKIWYTNMGHYAENFRQKEFIQHIVDGIEWVAGK
jgi:hypothetical protein